MFLKWFTNVLPPSPYLITLKKKRFDITFHSFLLKDKQTFSNQGQKNARKNFHSLKTLNLKPDNFVDTSPDSKHR